MESKIRLPKSSTMAAPTITVPTFVEMRPFSSRDGIITAIEEEIKIVPTIIAVKIS